MVPCSPVYLHHFRSLCCSFHAIYSCKLTGCPCCTSHTPFHVCCGFLERFGHAEGGVSGHKVSSWAWITPRRPRGGRGTRLNTCLPAVYTALQTMTSTADHNRYCCKCPLYAWDESAAAVVILCVVIISISQQEHAHFENEFGTIPSANTNHRHKRHTLDPM